MKSNGVIKLILLCMLFILLHVLHTYMVLFTY